MINNVWGIEKFPKFFLKKVLTTCRIYVIISSQKRKEVLKMTDYEEMEYLTEEDLENAAAWYDTQCDHEEWPAYGWEED